MSEAWREAADWLAEQAEQVIETSCARVFLAGDVAWKIKRPVRYAYLDFSTAEKRAWAIGRELEFNRHWAPDIYRRVRRLTRTAVGLAFDGAGETVESVLEMRRFDPAAVLALQPGPLDGGFAEELGRMIARAHAGAPLAPPDPTLGAYGYTVDSNEVALTDPAEGLEPGAVARLLPRLRAGREAVRPLLLARQGQGFARECHGDLHLGNLLVEEGAPLAFDCIEFSDVLRRMDVLYDAAFPVMDLAARNDGAAANRLLNGWFDEAARAFPAGLYSGLAALPQFLAVRASVRAHVTAASGDHDAAVRYLATAERLLDPPAPRLAAVGGLSGSGKTRHARLAAWRDFAAPGAVVLRSDLVRKRLAGVSPTERLPPAAYTPEWDERVHAYLFTEAAESLAAGWPTILDATFMDPARRDRAEAIAARAGVRFEGLWLEAPAEVLRGRLAERTGDASDADLDVLERQLAKDVGTVTWRRQSLQSQIES